MRFSLLPVFPQLQFCTAQINGGRRHSHEHFPFLRPAATSAHFCNSDIRPANIYSLNVQRKRQFKIHLIRQISVRHDRDGLNRKRPGVRRRHSQHIIQMPRQIRRLQRLQRLQQSATIIAEFRNAPSGIGKGKQSDSLIAGEVVNLLTNSFLHQLQPRLASRFINGRHAGRTVNQQWFIFGHFGICLKKWLHQCKHQQTQQQDLKQQQQIAAKLLKRRIDTLIVDDALPQRKRRDFHPRPAQLQKVQDDQWNQRQQKPCTEKIDEARPFHRRIHPCRHRCSKRMVGSVMPELTDINRPCRLRHIECNASCSQIR